MNQVPAYITHITSNNLCQLIQARCAFGTIYSLIVESEDFSLNDEVIATFKENEVFIMKDSYPLGIFNTFNGQIESLQHDDLFVRASIIPSNENTSHQKNLASLDTKINIHALIPSLTKLHLQNGDNVLWCVPSTHIVLERKI